MDDGNSNKKKDPNGASGNLNAPNGNVSHGVMEQFGKISEMDRSFDIRYWQEQGSVAIFSAAWDLVTTYYQHRKLDAGELRLQRSVEVFGRLSR